MKVVYFLISLITTILVVVLLGTGFGKVPPLGKFLSPQHGFWQNAEPTDMNFSNDLALTGLQHPAEVYFDERLVPHIFAANDEDAYFVQGFLHAKFRLWQMEFQSFAAGGRLTEILGPGPDSAYLNNDRSMRRLGMVYGAKRSLAEMEKDEVTRKNLIAYTDGVNSHITRLSTSELPLEYRLLNYVPEKWTTLKTALLLKYLSFDLTGSESDVEFTNAKSFFSEEDFNKLYPLMQDSASPVIQIDTPFPAPSVVPVIPVQADSTYYQWNRPVNVETIKADKDNGSNNWVAGGKKRKAGGRYYAMIHISD